ncbi:MAG: Na/Pi symporter [Candidatus Latescibacteria bacterium]|nr:Na/Pi symporter [Candidatus Latescibacterota bacterium]
MNRNIKKTFRVVLFAGSLYTFLLSINLLGEGLKLLGQGFIENLISLTSNPFLGLVIGIFTTAIVQSSSATTSITVGLVAAGVISINNAIPIIMGANIGTTITNTLVSMSHITRKNEFQRAFPAAMLHDFFNVLTVLVVFPLEIKFNLPERFSGYLTGIFANVGGTSITSPLKYVIAPVNTQLIKLFGSHGWILIIFALVLLFVALKFLVDSMKAITTRRLELLIDRYLFGSWVQSFVIGAMITSLIQSSSVTTSLVVPLIGAGILTIYKVFPYMVGANLGTTITAILAALAVGGPLGIQIAFAHFGFNLIGAGIWLPLKIVPIKIALLFGKLAGKSRAIALVYIIVLFYVVPLIIFFAAKLK